RLVFKEDGKFFTVGSNIFFQSRLIGSYTGGIGTTPLALTFNSNADAQAVTVALRRVSFFNGSDDPGAQNRTISALLTDGDGGFTTTNNVVFQIVEVNDAPTAVADSAETQQNQPVTINVLANDTDPEGDNLTITIISGPANGTTQVVAGQVVYTPNGNFIGSDSFTYRISDGNGGLSSANVSVVVTEVLDTPVAGNDAVQTLENQALLIDVATLIANDSDPNGPLDAVFNIITQPANGTLVDNLNGTYTYTPDPDFFGSDSFTYQLVDNVGGHLSNVATVAIEVTSTNNVPTVNDQNLQLDEDTTIAGQVVGSDADLDDLTYSVVAGPQHGTLLFNSDGTFTYTPNANYNGADSFTFVANDSEVNSLPGTVNITVDPVDDPLVAVDDTLNVGFGNTNNVNLLANDIDLDGHPLTVTIIQGPQHGSYTLNNGVLTYTHNGSPNLSDTIVYEISDGLGDSDQAQLNINVQQTSQSPFIQNNYLLTRQFTEQLEPIRVFLGTVSGQDVVVADNDSPNFAGGKMVFTITDGGALTDQFVFKEDGKLYTVGANLFYQGALIGTVSGGSNGDPLTVNFNGNATKQAVTVALRRVAFFNGSDDPGSQDRKISFYMTDGDGGFGTASEITFQITEVNDAPVLDANASAVNSQPNTDFNVGQSLALQVFDPDADSLQVTLTVTTGDLYFDALTLSQTESVVWFMTYNAAGQKVLDFTADQDEVNLLLNNLFYKPQGGNLNYADTLQVEVDDLGLSGIGGTLTDQASFQINIS
ncbi:MAG: tandem-95 repeat protein, partial [Chlamydiia bacterium]|nr:tandem-95 repeat protein [Chlamydiia bacterium]